MESLQEILEGIKPVLNTDDYKIFVASLEQSPVTSIRINPEKIKNDLPFEKVAWCQQGYYLTERPVFTLDPLMHAGAYYVQEASSMFIATIVEQITDKKPVKALDLCAAPGGKTTLLASALPEGSIVVSNEVIKTRASILRENAIKWGTGNIIVTNNDPTAFGDLHNLFDLIMIDAPCSGEGLLRKNDIALNEWSRENVELCSARQKRIISDVWESLKPGGILIYSTCTYNRKENEDNLAWIHANYEVENFDIEISPGWNIITTDTNGLKGFRFLPGKIKGEGFFVTVLRKIKEGKQPLFPASKKHGFQLAQKKEMDIVKHMVKQDTSMSYINHNGCMGIMPDEMYNLVNYLGGKLHIVHSYTPLAEIKGKDIIPRPECATSVFLEKNNCQLVELSLEDAIRFLRKDDFNPGAENGWNLACFKNIPLGWFKQMPNRINNYYPVEWRIKMQYEKNSAFSLWHASQ